MKHGFNLKSASFSVVLTLALAGAGLWVCADSLEPNDNGAGPDVRGLGREHPENRGGVASEPQAACFQSQQEPGGQLTLEQVLELALMHNPELVAFSHGVRAAEGAVRQAGVFANPELELESAEFGGSGVRKGFDAAETSARLTQPLELGGKRGKRQRIAQAEARLAGWEYEVKRQDVLAQTKKAFVDVLLAQGQLVLKESLLVVAGDVRKAAVERVKSGKVPAIEESKAGVEVAMARIARDRARLELDTARKRLATSWGGAEPVFTEAGGDLETVAEVPALEKIVARLDDMPEVARWNDEMARAGELLSLAQATRMPDIGISAGISRFEEDGHYAGTAGLSLPLPLFDRNSGGIVSAVHQKSRAEFEQRAARVRAAADLAETCNRLDAARAEALTTKNELLPGAQQAFDAAHAGYREGKFGLLEVLDSQRTLNEAKARYLIVLADYHKAKADLERLMGISLNTIQ